MNRLLWLAVIHLAATLLVAAERPNIVMIFTDDQRADAVGYSGNESIKTPNLDRLAKNGLVFRKCFVNTSICAVSRANLISGQYPERHGIDDFYKTFTKEQLNESVPARLQTAGYQTAFFGKWGIGDTPKKTHQGADVFDYWAGQPKQTNYFHQKSCKYVSWNGYTRPLDDLCDCPADAKGKKGVHVRTGKKNLKDPIHVDSVITPMHVNRFLDGRDTKKPFCMMVFFKSPHGPFGDFDPETESYTDGVKMPVPAAATLENSKVEPDVVRQSLGWRSGQQWLKNPKIIDKHMRDYYRSISSMDLGVGRIMALLEKRGLAENTVILFTSDNGHFFAEHGSAGKWLMYEPSLRVPGFIYDPRAKGGKSSDQFVITTDFSATMLALAGLQIPEDVSGRNLLALQKNSETDWRKDFYYTHPYGHNGAIAITEGVRGERFVYTRYVNVKPPYEQLFDLETDPDQLKNLATEPEHKAMLDKLRARCDELKKSIGAK